MAKNFHAKDTVVFVSYSKKDEALARAVVEQIESRFYVNVWWDQKLNVGKSYSDEIREALEAARLVVVLWTENSVRSEFVIDEATRAKDADKLFPISVGKPSLPPGFGLRQGLLMEATNVIAPQDLEMISERIEAALPTRIVRAVFKGSSVSPVITISAKEGDEVSILNGQIGETKLCLVAQAENLATLMPFVMSLSLIGYRVGLATSNGEYDRSWYDGFMGGLNGADVVLVSWFPIDKQAPDWFRTNEMNYMRDKCMMHMPFGSITIDETKELVSRFRPPEGDHYFKIDRLHFALSGNDLSETWTFVRTIRDLAMAEKAKRVASQQTAPEPRPGFWGRVLRLLRLSSVR